MQWEGSTRRRARGAATMLDLAFLLATAAFFGGSLALARWLDRLDRQESP